MSLVHIDVVRHKAPFKWVHVATIDEMEEFYRGVIPAMKEAARTHGFALAVHGSLRRDLDVIAVPWVEGHGTMDDLARAIQHAACGLETERYEWEAKPCGRFATAFPICWTELHDMISAGHVDLSVVGV